MLSNVGGINSKYEFDFQLDFISYIFRWHEKEQENEFTYQSCL